MTLLIPAPGVAIRVPSADGTPHTSFILTPPSDDRLVAVASMTTSHRGRRDFDNSCVLVPGEHPDVAHDSFIIYRLAWIDSVDRLQRGLDLVGAGRFRIRATASEVLSRRLAAGALSSRQTPNDVKAFVRRHRVLPDEGS